MKISEFAEKNNITSKMLRHYDEIGLIKPASIDPFTGYRRYSEEQSKQVQWIHIFKNLNFSLKEIKIVLDQLIDEETFIHILREKRIAIASELNMQIEKKIQIDTLIKILMKEGFHMEKPIDLTATSNENISKIMKNMPDIDIFFENANDVSLVKGDFDTIVIMRLDIWHLKSINDKYGHDVGDKVIVAIYNTFKENINKNTKQNTLGRFHGDEFIACFDGNKETAEKIASAIFTELEGYDFSALGCEENIGCYIGALVCDKNNPELRNNVDYTLELLETSREKGKNCLTIG